MSDWPKHTTLIVALNLIVGDLQVTLGRGHTWGARSAFGGFWVVSLGLMAVSWWPGRDRYSPARPVKVLLARPSQLAD